MSEQIKNIRIIEDEKYVQINDPADTRLEIIIQNLTELYPGFTVDICYHNTPHPADIIDKIGAKMIDDSIEMHLQSENFTPVEAAGIAMLFDKDFAEFSILHNKRNPDMYWTSQRIAANRDLWNVFISRTDGIITGYLMVTAGTNEIFCVSSTDMDESRRLLCAAISLAFRSGAADILRMVERGDAAEIEAAASLGFVQEGDYRGFRVVLPN